jgi:uncharacterized membrane protein
VGERSLWLVPVVFGLAGLGLAIGLVELDKSTRSFDALDFSSSTATQLLTATVGAAVAFTGFAFSVLLLVVQLASSQLSPRAMRVAYQSRLARISLGLWVGTLTYTLVLLESVTGAFVPQISIAVAGGLVLVSVVTFLLLVGRISRILRPGPMAERLRDEGLRSIDRLHALQHGAPGAAAESPVPTGAPTWVVRHAGGGGIVQAVDAGEIVRWAAGADGLVVTAGFVGDYVASGAELLRGYGGEPSRVAGLRRAVAVGAERTLEQDPMYAVRILVDIAIRALSPAVNDPTTAVQVIKRVVELLRALGGRQLGDSIHRDAAGRPRLVLRAPRWDDYVAVGLAEAIHFGAGSPQVARALRAALAELRDAVPPDRRSAVEARLVMLDEAVAKEYPGPLALAQAMQADRQGFGPAHSG